MAKVAQPVNGVLGQFWTLFSRNVIFAYRTYSGTPGDPSTGPTWPLTGQRIPHPEGVV